MISTLLWKNEKSNEIIDFLLSQLSYFENNFKRYKSDLPSLLSKECFDTCNLLNENFPEVNKFNSICFFLKSEIEKILNINLEYYYIHMINYQSGGEMDIHRHDHNEDYSFILYLNDCQDGFTNIHDDNDYNNVIESIMPEKGKILLMSSDVVHSASFSRNKKILVGGLKRNY